MKANSYLALFFVLFSMNSFSEVQEYKETENQGLNKLERIGHVEKYLSEIGHSMKSLELKLDENSKKMKDLDEVVKKLKIDLDKSIQERVGQKDNKAQSLGEDLNKVKSEVEALKLKDIEKLKGELSRLTDAVIDIQGRMKGR
jgi:SMC interacting uncharacterized protein involved in chromosome segregation